MTKIHKKEPKFIADSARIEEINGINYVIVKDNQGQETAFEVHSRSKQ